MYLQGKSGTFGHNTCPSTPPQLSCRLLLVSIEGLMWQWQYEGGRCHKYYARLSHTCKNHLTCTTGTSTAKVCSEAVLQKVVYPRPGGTWWISGSMMSISGVAKVFCCPLSRSLLQSPLSQHFCFSGPTASWLEELNHRKSIHFLL